MGIEFKVIEYWLLVIKQIIRENALKSSSFSSTLSSSAATSSMSFDKDNTDKLIQDNINTEHLPVDLSIDMIITDFTANIVKYTQGVRYSAPASSKNMPKGFVFDKPNNDAINSADSLKVVSKDTIAEAIARESVEFIKSLPNITEDGVPLWVYLVDTPQTITVAKAFEQSKRRKTFYTLEKLFRESVLRPDENIQDTDERRTDVESLLQDDKYNFNSRRSMVTKIISVLDNSGRSEGGSHLVDDLLPKYLHSNFGRDCIWGSSLSDMWSTSIIKSTMGQFYVEALILSIESFMTDCIWRHSSSGGGGGGSGCKVIKPAMDVIIDGAWGGTKLYKTLMDLTKDQKNFKSFNTTTYQRDRFINIQGLTPGESDLKYINYLQMAVDKSLLTNKATNVLLRSDDGDYICITFMFYMRKLLEGVKFSLLPNVWMDRTVNSAIFFSNRKEKTNVSLKSKKKSTAAAKSSSESPIIIDGDEDEERGNSNSSNGGSPNTEYYRYIGIKNLFESVMMVHDIKVDTINTAVYLENGSIVKRNGEVILSNAAIEKALETNKFLDTSKKNGKERSGGGGNTKEDGDRMQVDGDDGGDDCGDSCGDDDESGSENEEGGDDEDSMVVDSDYDEDGGSEDEDESVKKLRKSLRDKKNKKKKKNVKSKRSEAKQAPKKKSNVNVINPVDRSNMKRAAEYYKDKKMESALALNKLCSVTVGFVSALLLRKGDFTTPFVDCYFDKKEIEELNAKIQKEFNDNNMDISDNVYTNTSGVFKAGKPLLSSKSKKKNDKKGPDLKSTRAPIFLSPQNIAVELLGGGGIDPKTGKFDFKFLCHGTGKKGATWWCNFGASLISDNFSAATTDANSVQDQSPASSGGESLNTINAVMASYNTSDLDDDNFGDTDASYNSLIKRSSGKLIKIDFNTNHLITSFEVFLKAPIRETLSPLLRYRLTNNMKRLRFTLDYWVNTIEKLKVEYIHSVKHAINDSHNDNGNTFLPLVYSGVSVESKIVSQQKLQVTSVNGFHLVPHMNQQYRQTSLLADPATSAQAIDNIFLIPLHSNDTRHNLRRSLFTDADTTASEYIYFVIEEF